MAVDVLARLNTATAREALTALRATEKAKDVKAALDAYFARDEGAADEATSPYSGPGYGFDTYAAGLIGPAVEAVLEARTEEWGDIQRIYLAHYDLMYEIMAVIIEGDGGYFEVEIAGPDHTLPGHLDDVDTDDMGGEGAGLLNQLIRHHGEDPEDEGMPSWGDAFGLPESMYRYAVVKAAALLKERLSAEGLPVEGARTAMGGHDDDWDDAEGFVRMARKKLATLPPALARDLVVMCFDTEAERAVFTG